MACVVYCLVPDPEQIDPLVERLKDAGVKTEDIAVVPRRHWPHPSPSAQQQASPLSDAVSSCFWGMTLTPAAIWWRWALGAQAAGGTMRAGGHSIIPLEIYENKLEALKRRRP